MAVSKYFSSLVQEKHFICLKVLFSRVNKLRIERARLQEMSGLKKSVFDKLVVSMTALQLTQKSQQETAAKPKTNKRTQSFIESVEAKAKGKSALPLHIKCEYCTD